MKRLALSPQRTQRENKPKSLVGLGDLGARTPIEMAAALYHRDGRNFLDVVQEHMSPNGIVINRPDCFALAQAVELDDGRLAWLVNAAAGSLRELVRHIPWFLPWIAFYRRKPEVGSHTYGLRVYPLTQFINRGLRGCKRIQRNNLSESLGAGLTS